MQSIPHLISPKKMIGALQVCKKLVVKVVLLLSALYSQFSAKFAEQATNRVIS
jgi:hypothetical protein